MILRFSRSRTSGSKAWDVASESLPDVHWYGQSGRLLEERWSGATSRVRPTSVDRLMKVPKSLYKMVKGVPSTQMKSRWYMIGAKPAGNQSHVPYHLFGWQLPGACPGFALRRLTKMPPESAAKTGQAPPAWRPKHPTTISVSCPTFSDHLYSHFHCHQFFSP
jgi:hypothetical protein